MGIDSATCSPSHCSSASRSLDRSASGIPFKMAKNVLLFREPPPKERLIGVCTLTSNVMNAFLCRRVLNLDDAPVVRTQPYRPSPRLGNYPTQKREPLTVPLLRRVWCSIAKKSISALLVCLVNKRKPLSNAIREAIRSTFQPKSMYQCFFHGRREIHGSIQFTTTLR
jgi:hypothetical protein